VVDFYAIAQANPLQLVATSSDKFNLPILGGAYNITTTPFHIILVLFLLTKEWVHLISQAIF
jgi:hypothetical protein